MWQPGLLPFAKGARGRPGLQPSPSSEPQALTVLAPLTPAKQQWLNFLNPTHPHHLVIASSFSPAGLRFGINPKSETRDLKPVPRDSLPSEPLGPLSNLLQGTPYLLAS